METFELRFLTDQFTMVRNYKIENIAVKLRYFRTGPLYCAQDAKRLTNFKNRSPALTLNPYTIRGN